MDMLTSTTAARARQHQNHSLTSHWNWHHIFARRLDYFIPIL